MKWPECSAAYQIYINSDKTTATTSTTSTFFPCYPFTPRTNKLDTVEIITPLVEINPNKSLEPHKQLTLKRLHEDTTIYKIGVILLKK